MVVPRPLPPSEFDESDLVARVRAGDEEAFSALFIGYHPELVSYATTYLRSSDAAEDIVQEVFLRLWDRRAAWDVHGGVAQYLYRAVRNAALDALKHDRIVSRYQTDEGAQQERSSAGNAGVDRMETRELATVVARAIATLPPRCQEVFRLSRYRRLSQRDIAATLGITVNTVNAQLGRALRTLDEAVRRWEEGVGTGRE